MVHRSIIDADVRLRPDRRRVVTGAAVRPLVAGVLLLIATGVSACAPTTDGPLVGPRVEADTTAVCVPATAGPQVFLSEVLTNSGESDMEIIEVTGEASGTESVEYLIDTAGPGLGQIIGASGLPANNPIGGEEDIFDRARPAAETLIPAGTSAALLILITPDGETAETNVSSVRVDYHSGGHDYREEILVDYAVSSDDAC
jgi:hypothetical protein